MSHAYADAGYVRPVSHADVDTRATFITRTYAHLFGAIFAFVLLELALFSSVWAERIAAFTFGTNWLLILGAFMVVGWIASHVAFASRSLGAQYAGLALYVAAEAIIFVPLLWIAQSVPNAVQSAALVTLVGFGGLTMVAFQTRKDFSFLGGFLRWGMVIALVLIVGGVVFGFNLGVFFSVAMVGLAGAAILYDTSNVIRRYPEDRYVGAALALFASVALMFWYVLQIFLASRD